MQARLLMATALSSLVLAACSSSSNSPRAVATPPALNDDGSPITATIAARFDPATGVIPLPNDLLLRGTTDLTLNIPVAATASASDPTRALNNLDGWSTVAPWSFTTSTAVRASSLVPGASVRMFKVVINPSTRAVLSVTRELAATEFVTAVSTSDTTGRTIGIVPLRPLEQLSSYMVVVTDDVKDTLGNDATPDQTYFLAKRTSPLITPLSALANPATCPTVATSTDPLLPTTSGCSLEPLRQLINTQEAAAATAGVPRADIVLSWVATTQSITPVLMATRAITQPSVATLANSGLTTAAAGLPPVANIYIGVMPLKYYSTAPSASNPTGPLTGSWKAAPGAYNPPFNALGLDPTSTNLTFANPIPVAASTQTVPVLLTVPNAASGRTKPAAGWPIVIFQHGITRNRSDALGIAATMAAQGFAVIAIDQPLHGVGPTSPFYIENTPFGPIAGERTFDLDLSNNTTGAPGPDGVIDASGAYSINLTSLLTSRDNLRQAVADLFTLAKSIPAMSYDGDATPDFDGSRMEFVGQSLGAMVGLNFIALDSTVNTAVLSVPGGGIARLLDGSPTFGPRIRAGLAAATPPVVAGTLTYDSFMGAAQQAVDSADPINFAALAVATGERILMHEVVGGGAVLPDQVIPNSVAGAPLSGTEPLIRALGLPSITGPIAPNPAGIKGVVRFIVGDHGSLLSPAASPAATVEMQTQMASYIVSNGTAVQVTNTSVIRTQ
ncbi:MAG: lipase [Pseudomonadota bacterium]|nr:lipase [Pseudomonadota bacterium]